MNPVTPNSNLKDSKSYLDAMIQQFEASIPSMFNHGVLQTEASKKLSANFQGEKNGEGWSIVSGYKASQFAVWNQQKALFSEFEKSTDVSSQDLSSNVLLKFFTFEQYQQLFEAMFPLFKESGIYFELLKVYGYTASFEEAKVLDNDYKLSKQNTLVESTAACPVFLISEKPNSRSDLPEEFNSGYVIYREDEEEKLCFCSVNTDTSLIVGSPLEFKKEKSDFFGDKLLALRLEAFKATLAKLYANILDKKKILVTGDNLEKLTFSQGHVRGQNYSLEPRNEQDSLSFIRAFACTVQACALVLGNSLEDNVSNDNQAILEKVEQDLLQRLKDVQLQYETMEPDCRKKWLAFLLYISLHSSFTTQNIQKEIVENAMACLRRIYEKTEEKDKLAFAQAIFETCHDNSGNTSEKKQIELSEYQKKMILYLFGLMELKKQSEALSQEEKENIKLELLGLWTALDGLKNSNQTMFSRLCDYLIRADIIDSEGVEFINDLKVNVEQGKSQIVSILSPSTGEEEIEDDKRSLSSEVKKNGTSFVPLLAIDEDELRTVNHPVVVSTVPVSGPLQNDLHQKHEKQTVSSGSTAEIFSILPLSSHIGDEKHKPHEPVQSSSLQSRGNNVATNYYTTHDFLPKQSDTKEIESIDDNFIDTELKVAREAFYAQFNDLRNEKIFEKGLHGILCEKFDKPAEQVEYSIEDICLAIGLTDFSNEQEKDKSRIKCLVYCLALISQKSIDDICNDSQDLSSFLSNTAFFYGRSKVEEYKKEYKLCNEGELLKHLNTVEFTEDLDLVGKLLQSMKVQPDLSEVGLDSTLLLSGNRINEHVGDGLVGDASLQNVSNPEERKTSEPQFIPVVEPDASAVNINCDVLNIGLSNSVSSSGIVPDIQDTQRNLPSEPINARLRTNTEDSIASSVSSSIYGTNLSYLDILQNKQEQKYPVLQKTGSFETLRRWTLSKNTPENIWSVFTLIESMWDEPNREKSIHQDASLLLNFVHFLPKILGTNSVDDAIRLMSDDAQFNKIKQQPPRLIFYKYKANYLDMQLRLEKLREQYLKYLKQYKDRHGKPALDASCTITPLEQQTLAYPMLQWNDEWVAIPCRNQLAKMLPEQAQGITHDANTSNSIAKTKLSDYEALEKKATKENIDSCLRILHGVEAMDQHEKGKIDMAVERITVQRNRLIEDLKKIEALGPKMAKLTFAERGRKDRLTKIKQLNEALLTFVDELKLLPTKQDISQSNTYSNVNDSSSHLSTSPSSHVQESHDEPAAKPPTRYFLIKISEAVKVLAESPKIAQQKNLIAPYLKKIVSDILCSPLYLFSADIRSKFFKVPRTTLQKDLEDVVNNLSIKSS